MKKLVRSYVINLVSILATTHILPALTIENSAKGLLIAALVFMIANGVLTLVFKIILLPLNLLTLGLFAWLTNVLAIYALTTVISDFHLASFFFSGNLGSAGLTCFFLMI